MTDSREQVRVFQRVSSACDRCRTNKQRCDVSDPCLNCVHSGAKCERRKRTPTRSAGERPAKRNAREGTVKDRSPPRREARKSSRDARAVDAAVGLGDLDSALASSKKRFGSEYHHGEEKYSIPSYVFDQPSASVAPAATIAISEVLGYGIPCRAICDELLASYFESVHWFSLVIHEPSFRARFYNILQAGRIEPSETSFLLLSLAVLAMGSWYKSREYDETSPGAQRWVQISNTYLNNVRSHLIDIFGEESLEFIQICILLGSHYLSHGQPKFSFSILGAATKTAQAMNLHRDLSSQLSPVEMEQRQRVWWTLYTWDRLATIIYGRPLSINDEDCDIPMPGSYEENAAFIHKNGTPPICFSNYQIHLNTSYKIASPMLGKIFGGNTESLRYEELQDLADETYNALDAWRSNLPHELSFMSEHELADGQDWQARFRQLQRLALELTFHTLVITIYRPVLVTKNPSSSSQDSEISFGTSNMSSGRRYTHFTKLFNSATELSRIAERQSIFNAARKTRLVAFMGIGIFSASVVMAICALENPLSNIAQEAKRCTFSMLKMQRLLAPHSAMNAQCCSIVERLVQVITAQEGRMMLERDNSSSASEHEKTSPVGLTPQDTQGFIPASSTWTQPPTSTPFGTIVGLHSMAPMGQNVHASSFSLAEDMMHPFDAHILNEQFHSPIDPYLTSNQNAAPCQENWYGGS